MLQSSSNLSDGMETKKHCNNEMVLKSNMILLVAATSKDDSNYHACDNCAYTCPPECCEND